MRGQVTEHVLRPGIESTKSAYAEDVLEGRAVHGGRQHQLSPEDSRHRKRRDVAVVLVYEPRAGGVPQQHPQSPRHAPLAARAAVCRKLSQMPDPLPDTDLHQLNDLQRRSAASAAARLPCPCDSTLAAAVEPPDFEIHQ